MIEELTAQFNSTATATGINVNSIVQQINEDKKRRADIERFNETFKVLHNQVLRDGVDQILNDLQPFGIISEESLYCDNLRVFVGIVGKKLDIWNNVFSFEISIKSQDVYLTDNPNSVHKCVSCQYEFVASFGGGGKVGLKFDSVEGMLADSRVVRRITELIASRMR